MKWQKKSIDSRAAAGKISKYFNIKFGVFLVDENYRKKTQDKILSTTSTSSKPFFVEANLKKKQEQ
jgi:vacuolar-type H+-ATPase subunit F/Vma7